MTNGPPSTAASSSKSPLANGDSKPPSQPAPFSTPSSNSAVQHPEANYSSWSSFTTSPYSAYYAASSSFPDNIYPTQTLNPLNSHYPNVHPNISSAHVSYPQHYPYMPSQAQNVPPASRPSASARKLQPVQTRSSTPPLPEPETYKYWDEAVKNFLLRAKLLQTLKGFEHDMLVLNPEWEREVIPRALTELVAGLQIILDRISGKKKADEEAMDMQPDVNTLGPDVRSDEEPLLDERKLDYLSLASEEKARSHSSVNKSISQFLARTRSRNDASNRAEFLYSPAEKRRRLQEAGINPEGVQLSSCARVDAKPIDRDKQMQYDIAKNGEGPLIKTVIQDSKPGPSSTGQESTQGVPFITGAKLAKSDKKRKFVDFVDKQVVTESGKASKAKANKKSKGKKKVTVEDSSLLSEEAESDDGEDIFETRITAASREALNERLVNIEEHLAVRYVPSIPRTFLARLKYLEDQLINIEKEYPPWAALHFNQPSRGWPAPPRATPIIVPPHLRPSSSSVQNIATVPSSTVSTSLAASSTASTAMQASSLAPVITSRKTNSSLHRAVLDRLEVQRAMNEMSALRDPNPATP